MMYYFCDDYIIGEQVVSRKKKYLKTLKNDFFGVDPAINVSAIVGMNGDGKSSIVELAMRLINNFAKSYQLLEEQDNLCRIQGVKAELYYMVDDVIYRIAEEHNNQEVQFGRYADLTDHGQVEWQVEYKREKAEDMEIEPLFYTIVSNYSHYAYNIYDFEQEWEEREDEEDDNEKCWLHHLFHKNDGYLTPITLHPYRDMGNPDINREKHLAKQRLLSLFINADKPTENPKSFRRINGKDAETLVLTIQEDCMLQKEIIQRLKAARPKNNLGMALGFLKQFCEKEEFDEIAHENLIDTVLPSFFEEPIDLVMQQDDEFPRFVDEVIEWLKDNGYAIFPGSGDIRQVVKRLNTIEEKFRHRTKAGFFGGKYGKIMQISSAQLGVLSTIYQIMHLLGIDPFMAVADYQTLQKKDKSLLYKAYKVLSIIDTYKLYKDMLNDDVQENHIVKIAEYDRTKLRECVELVLRDNDTHITRKIRQVDCYLAEGFDGGDVYERIGTKDDESGKVYVPIDKLREHYRYQHIELDKLPPAIYNWDLQFKGSGEQSATISMDSFSSGEKQMLYSLGAIIYHLKNINSSSTLKYHYVNVILEEIELYYHPELQRNYIYRLLELIGGANLDNFSGINITFVTHSPFILSDIPKNNVLFLRNGLPTNEMQENTFGANIHALLKNGFFLSNLPIGEFAYQKINGLFRLLNSGDFAPEELDEIYQEILLVGEPFLRNQLLNLYNGYRGPQLNNNND